MGGERREFGKEFSGQILGDNVGETVDGEAGVVDPRAAGGAVGDAQLLLEEVGGEQNDVRGLGKSLRGRQVANALVGKLLAVAHDLDARKGRPRHAVPHHVEKRQFLQRIRLCVRVRRVQLLLDLRDALRNIQCGVPLGRPNPLHHIHQRLFKHGMF
eukprot:scaffold40245_cov51-Attheya_sp.AAC.3